jgi:hypothetical protein
VETTSAEPTAVETAAAAEPTTAKPVAAASTETAATAAVATTTASPAAAPGQRGTRRSDADYGGCEQGYHRFA